MMDICVKFAQACAGHKLEKVSCGILLQLTNVLEGTKVADTGSADTTGNWDLIVQKFSSVVDTYRNAFSGVGKNKKATLLERPTDAPPEPMPKPGQPQKKRLLSEVEKGKCNRNHNHDVQLQAQKTTKRNQNCGFCGSTEHQRQTVCPLMCALGKRKDNVSEFLNYLFSSAPFSLWENNGTLMETIPREAKHLVVHKMYTTSPSTHVRPEYLNTVYQATLIGKTGHPLPNYQLVDFEGQAIVALMTAISKKKTKSYVFSTIDQQQEKPKETRGL